MVKSKTAISGPYIYFSRFKLTPNAGGGCRRELQLAQILSPLRFQFISAWEQPALSRRLRLKIRLPKKKTHQWDRDFQPYAERMETFSRKWAGKISRNVKLAVMDDPLFFPSLTKALKQRKIPLVILSQNLESLSRSQINPDYQMDLFRQELELLSLSDLIVTISREETYLLDNLGLPTFYLPYYPVKEIEIRMKKVRQQRSQTQKSGILLMGTVNNQVTKEGIQHIIQYWQNHLAPRLDEKLIIAGYGTHKIQSSCAGSKIEFKGQLSDSDLDLLLTKISVCLNYQNAGSGALTKIREMQIAGVPVAANSHSARSHYHLPGLVEFTHLAGAEKAIAEAKEQEGRIPIPPRPPESKLLQAVKALVPRLS